MTEQYAYRAMDRGGRIVKGRLDARNRTDLERRLGRNGLDLIRYQRRRQGVALWRRRAIDRADIINFFFFLQQMVQADLSVVAALREIRESLDKAVLRDVSATLIEEVEGGQSLSQALENFPWLFDKAWIGIVQVGEESGKLPQVLRDLVQFLRWQDELLQRFRRLLSYPLILGIFVFAMLLFIMIFLVPQLEQFLQGLGQELPGYTQLLVAFSRFFVSYWPLMLLCAVLLPTGISVLVKNSPWWRMRWDRMLLYSPILGPLLRRFKVARFVHYFALLYGSGLSVLQALEVGQVVVGNEVLRQALVDVRRNIAEGMALSQSFAQVDFFPSLLVRMLHAGEQTGELGTTLRNVCYFYEREVDEGLARLQPLIQPILTLLLGSVMIWVIVAVLYPLFQSISVIGQF